MEIKRVILNGIGPFETLEIPLAPTEQNPSNVTAFVGSNGTGKTSVLQALATSLSWFTARLRTEKGSGNPIPADAILNAANACAIKIDISDSLWSSANSNGHEIADIFQWTLTKARPGRKAQDVWQQLKQLQASAKDRQLTFPDRTGGNFQCTNQTNDSKFQINKSWKEYNFNSIWCSS